MKSDNELKSFKEVQDAVEVIFQNINHMGNEHNVEEAVISVLEHTHPTLKQLYFKHIILASIKYFNGLYKQNFYDLRDEATCKTSNEMMPIVDKAMIPFI